MSGLLDSPASILDDILAQVGEPSAGDAVRFHGQDPVLPTIFRMGDFGAAAIAATALTAARIHERATGIVQTIDIDAVAATVAMRSSRQLVVDPPLKAPDLHTVGTYRTRDERWVFMQRLFPHHLQRQLEVLRCEPTEESIAAAVAQHDGQWLEDQIVAHGASATLVRTREEWTAHPQFAAVSSLPLLEVTKIGDSDPVPLPFGDRPLSGLRVLDVTRVLAGPTAARTLAEHGADVLRISSPRGPDNLRMMIDTGHGKRSAVLDLRAPDDLTTMFDLIDGVDVYSHGYRPGAMEAFGLGPERLAERRPGIINVSITAFGRLGPWSTRRGFDSVVQSATGMALAGSDTDRPVHMPGNPLDYITGYLGALGALVALERRAADGGSYLVEVSLARTGYELDRRIAPVDRQLARQRSADLPADLLESLSLHRSSEFGELRYLAPVAQLSHTRAEWELPTVPADHDEPRWRSADADL